MRGERGERKEVATGMGAKTRGSFHAPVLSAFTGLTDLPFLFRFSPSLTVCFSLVPHSIPKLSFMLWLITELTGCSGGCPWRWPSPCQPVPCGGVEHRMEGCSEGGKNGKTGLAEGHILMSRDGPATPPRTGPGNWERDNRNTWWWRQPPQHLICR